MFVVLKLTPANARFDVTVMFRLDSEPFVTTKPVDPEPPKNTLILPIPETVKLLPPVRVKTSVWVFWVNVRLLVENETPAIDKLPVTLALKLVSNPLVITRPDVEPPPKLTAILPTPGTVRLLLPVIEKTLVVVFSVIRSPLVLNVAPPTTILLFTVISRLDKEPFVMIIPVVAGLAVEQPRITLTVPIFDWLNVALPDIVKTFVETFPVIRRPDTPRVTPATVKLEPIVMSKLLTKPPLMTMPVLPGLVCVAELPRTIFAVPSPVAVRLALPVRLKRSGRGLLAAA